MAIEDERTVASERDRCCIDMTTLRRMRRAWTWPLGLSRVHSGDPYPELRAGGFTRFDGTAQFYGRVHALLRTLGPAPTVLDLGAGRGVTEEGLLDIHRWLLDLRASAGKVVGVDVEDSVLTNPFVTEAHVIEPGGRLPIHDRAVDLVLCDHAFEHLVDPAAVARELRRVIREGGWICARTPNKWGYIALAARAVPNRLHAAVVRRAQPIREERDVFPTYYRLNTQADIAEQFPPSEFEHVIYGWEPELAYFATSRAAAAAVRSMGRLTPERLRPVLLVFLHRYGPVNSSSDL